MGIDTRVSIPLGIFFCNFEGVKVELQIAQLCSYHFRDAHTYTEICGIK